MRGENKRSKRNNRTDYMISKEKEENERKGKKRSVEKELRDGE